MNIENEHKGSWVWDYGYTFHAWACSTIDSVDEELTWPGSLFYLESIACQNEGIRRGEWNPKQEGVIL